MRIDKISFNRILVYIIIAGFMPIFYSIFYCWNKQKEWDHVSERIKEIHEIAETKMRKQYLNHIVRNAYRDVDQFYLENQLESLRFLKREKESLEHLLHNPTFTGNESAEKRYHLITSSANHLEFMQGSPYSAEGVHEVACMLSHPVEVDINDLKEILNRVEGSRKGKPQLIITELKLNKKSYLNGNEVYECNLKLKKREFLN